MVTIDRNCPMLVLLGLLHTLGAVVDVERLQILKIRQQKQSCWAVLATSTRRRLSFCFFEDYGFILLDTCFKFSEVRGA